MPESITFAHLDRALTQLGFQKSVSVGGPIGYRHAPSDTVVLFKTQLPNELVLLGLNQAKAHRLPFDLAV